MLDSASRESASQAALLPVISSLSVRPKVVVCNIHFAGFSYDRYDFWHMKKVTSGISPTKMRAPSRRCERARHTSNFSAKKKGRGKARPFGNWRVAELLLVVNGNSGGLHAFGVGTGGGDGAALAVG
jgi:hypothetical protein